MNTKYNPYDDIVLSMYGLQALWEHNEGLCTEEIERIMEQLEELKSLRKFRAEMIEKQSAILRVVDKALERYKE